jgi:hypothetical protein
VPSSTYAAALTSSKGRLCVLEKSGHGQHPSRPSKTPWDFSQTANRPPTPEEQGKDWRCTDSVVIRTFHLHQKSLNCVGDSSV